MAAGLSYLARTITLWWFVVSCSGPGCVRPAAAADAEASQVQSTQSSNEWLSQIDVAGSLRFDYFSSSRDLDDRTNFPGLTAEFQASDRLSDDNRIDFDIRSGLDLSKDQNGVISDTRLIGGYWLSKGDVVDWRIGQQLVRWGRADAINPIDFFTPHDYTVYLPLEEDQRLSIPAIRADFHIVDGGELTLVVEPSFTPTLVPKPANNPALIRQDLPQHTVTRPQVGARYSQSGENLDWSIAGFSGYSPLQLQNFQSLTAAGPSFRQFYPKILGVGGDIAHNFDKIGFRAEAAYIHPYDTPAGTAIKPYFFLVTGIDRALDIIGRDNWNVNVQLVLNYTPDVETSNDGGSNPLAQAAAQVNRTLYGQINRLQVGATARISAHWVHETLQTELFAYVTADPSTYFVRPLATYSVTDQWKLLFGGEYYGGSKLGYFGLLQKNATVFLEVRRDF